MPVCLCRSRHDFATLSLCAGADKTLRVWNQEKFKMSDSEHGQAGQVLEEAVKWNCIFVLEGHKQEVTHCCVQEWVPDKADKGSRQPKYARAFSCSKDGSVSSPRHKYSDRNPDSTEIYLRFVVPIVVIS